MTSKRLLRTLRVLFFGICVMGAATKFVWERRPDLVFWVDENLKTHSIHEERRALDRGKRLLQQGDTAAGIQSLTELAESMDEVLNGDRLEPIMSQTLGLLIKAHDGLGESEEALHWSDKLHALDSRLVTAELQRASLLTRMGRVDEAVRTLTPLVSLSSVADLEVNTKLLAELSRAGDVDGALGILVRLGDQGPLGLPLEGWEVRQRTGETWSAPQRFSVTQPEGSRPGFFGSTVELPATGPDGAPLEWTSLRIDAPRGSSFTLSNPAFSLLAPDGSVLAELGPDDLGKPRNMSLAVGVLTATGHADPYMLVDAPGEGALVAHSLRFQFDLKPTLSAELSAVLTGTTSTEAMARLREDLSSRDSWDQPRADGGPSPKELVERLEALLDA